MPTPDRRDARALTRRELLAGVGAPFALAAGAGSGARTVERICREAWGAAPPTGPYVRHEVRRLTVHHSAVVLTDNREAPQAMRDHQAYHQSRGWPDIAYHLLIDRNGNVYQGRPIWARGDTGTDYDPTGHLLVLCEGNFEVQWSSWRQVRALVDVLAWGSRRHGVPVWRIAGHRDFASTACPGRRLYRHLEDGSVRERVRDRLDAGGIRLLDLCGWAGRRRVREIEAGTH